MRVGAHRTVHCKQPDFVDQNLNPHRHISIRIIIVTIERGLCVVDVVDVDDAYAMDGLKHDDDNNNIAGAGNVDAVGDCLCVGRCDKATDEAIRLLIVTLTVAKQTSTGTAKARHCFGDVYGYVELFGTMCMMSLMLVLMQMLCAKPTTCLQALANQTTTTLAWIMAIVII